MAPLRVLKTRVAHGYCSRNLVAEACSYANICEKCDNFATRTEFVPALQAQLADVTALRDDAETRGWNTEVARHARVIDSLTRHLDRLAHCDTPSPTACQQPPGPVNRGVVRGHRTTSHPTRHLHLSERPQHQDPGLHHRLEQAQPTIRLDQNRGRGPRQSPT